jgi:hypothetical protein
VPAEPAALFTQAVPALAEADPAPILSPGDSVEQSLAEKSREVDALRLKRSKFNHKEPLFSFNGPSNGVAAFVHNPALQTRLF